jgi:hypothetical protein
MTARGQSADNEEMVLLEAALVVGMVWLVVYGTIRLLTRPQSRERHPVAPTGAWRAVHYDVQGRTHVVLQRTSPDGDYVLDEHVIATVPVEDPEYDAKFLAAMSTARERRALFEAEERDG